MESLPDFSSLKLPEALVAHLVKMGFNAPTPIQATAIPSVLEGKDLLGIAPTGTGKTGAFGIPAIASLSVQTDKQVLIIAPTRELAAQIFKFMNQMGEPLKIRGVLLVGGESFRYQFAGWNAGVDFMVATPGRLMDHVNRGLDLKHVGVLVLDEVDQMLDMGFAPQVEEIVSRVPAERQTVFFSATMPPAIQKMVQRYLKDPVRITVGANPDHAPKIKEEKIQVSRYDKATVFLAQVQKREGKILVFARTQRGAEQVRDRLEEAGIETACLHGGRTQAERKRALDAFRRGRVRILVATDIAARGIDVPDIETVINFDLPATKEDYLHRIGRTGRFGKEGTAITFVDDSDRGRGGMRGRPGGGRGYGGGGGSGSSRSSAYSGSQSRYSAPEKHTSSGGTPAPRKKEASETSYDPRPKKKETRAGHSGSVRFFRAGDSAIPQTKSRPESSESSADKPKQHTRDWVRSEKNVVRRRKPTE